MILLKLNTIEAKRWALFWFTWIFLWYLVSWSYPRLSFFFFVVVEEKSVHGCGPRTRKFVGERLLRSETNVHPYADHRTSFWTDTSSLTAKAHIYCILPSRRQLFYCSHSPLLSVFFFGSCKDKYFRVFPSSLLSPCHRPAPSSIRNTLLHNNKSKSN